MSPATDARTEHGIDEVAPRRALRQGGADILFVESPRARTSAHHLRTRRQTTCWPTWLRADAHQSSHAKCWSSLVIASPSFRSRAAGSDGSNGAAYAALKAQGSSAGMAQPLYPFSQMSTLMGFQEVWDFEKKYAED